MEPYFERKKRLMPRPTDLSFYNWETQMSTSNPTPNFQVWRGGGGRGASSTQQEEAKAVCPPWGWGWGAGQAQGRGRELLTSAGGTHGHFTSHARPTSTSSHPNTRHPPACTALPPLQVIADNEAGLLFKNKRDRKVINVDPRAKPGDNSTRTELATAEYMQVGGGVCVWG